MDEAAAIHASLQPNTRASLAGDLARLGLRPGMTVLVHSSLSRLGWTAGGAVAVVQALMDVLTPEGTLVMPTHCGENSDPALWQHPPVPPDWVPVIREHLPAYDPRITPTRGMGRIVEVFRTFPGVLRSAHPALSFAAWGQSAAFVTEDHALEYAMGERSPLARVYDLDGWVLLLGVGFANNTSFHLAEYRRANPPLTQQAAALLEHGRRVWKTYPDVETDDGPFPAIGAAFETTGAVQVGRVGVGEARFFRQRPAVDFAVGWLNQAR